VLEKMFIDVFLSQYFLRFPALSYAHVFTCSAYCELQTIIVGRRNLTFSDTWEGEAAFSEQKCPESGA